MSSSHNNTATSDVVRNAWQSYRSGDPSEAERLCRSALESNPDAAGIVYLLGILEFEKKNYKAAIELFTRATTLDPDDARVFTYLGAAYSMTGDSAQAIEACDRAIVLNPGLAEAHFQLGLVNQAQDRLEEARASYGNALEHDPENPDIHDALGTLFHKSCQFEDAIDSYRKGLALSPESASLHNNLGSALQKRGDLDGANAEYRRALELEPDRAEFNYNLGSNFELQGQLDHAYKNYQRATELDPRYIQAQMSLANLCDERGNTQQAVRMYQQIIKMHPRDAEAHGNLGRILHDVKKLDEARVCYENVLRIDSEDTEAHEGLGDVYKDLGKIDLAIDHFRRASELGSISATHFLAALTHEDTQIAPRQYIEELFDSYSKDFEEHLVESLSYESPGLLYEAFMRVNKGDRRFKSAIDLGCGTGLAGVAFKSIIECLDGVDLSPEMLKQAGKKGIYRNLDAADIVEYLNAGKNKYELFIAADVLIYIGNIFPVFEAVKHSASRGAYFVFTVETTDDGNYVLQPTGRYAHSKDYIRSVARASDFKVLRSNPVPLRKEDERWVNGRLFVLKAGAGQ